MFSESLFTTHFLKNASCSSTQKRIFAFSIMRTVFLKFWSCIPRAYMPRNRLQLCRSRREQIASRAFGPTCNANFELVFVFDTIIGAFNFARFWTALKGNYYRLKYLESSYSRNGFRHSFKHISREMKQNSPFCASTLQTQSTRKD